MRPRPVRVVALSMIAGLTLATPAATAIDAERPHYIRPGAPGEPSVRISPSDIAFPEPRQLSHHEVHFLGHMIPHHGQALMMSEWAPDRAENQRLRILANQILQAQDTEIEQMGAILSRFGHPVPDPRDHEGHENMPGMLTPEQMAQLEASTGRDFDLLFLEFMIYHHHGALTMIENLEQATNRVMNADVAAMTHHMYDDQWTEIGRMELLLAELRGDG
jgi:uncharacterized protein (DUF305 family)